MKTTILALALSLTLIAGFASTTNARTKSTSIRATEMTSTQWSDLGKQGQEVTIEFRQGDELPVSFEAKGDFLETTQKGISYVVVKRDFWLKPVNNDLQVSTDGVNFKPISEVASGSFSAGAGADQNGGAANAINLVFEAMLK